MAPTIHELTQGIPTLGSYAGVIDKIEQLLQDPRTTLTHLGEAIEKDPDLAARLLRLGNSAFYGFAQRLETVADTIGLIGIQQVQDLILASSVMELFEGISADEVTMESFWRHSLACGIGARFLAIARQLPNADRFFIGGLLHDVGRLVLLSQAPKPVTQVFGLYRSRRMLLREAEREVLGFDHAQVGEELLRGWRLPPKLTDAVAWHHQPFGAGIFQLESSVLHVADYLVHAMQVGNSGEHFVPPLDCKAWERLGLPTSILDSVLKSIDDQLAAVETSFLNAHKSRGRA